MRKIERQMIAAIYDLIGNPDYSGTYWRSGNTIVEQHFTSYRHQKDDSAAYQRIISVRLHGNEIAAIRPAEGTVWVSDCGWQTATTKSRLWVLLSAFTRCPYALCQQQHQWLRIMPNGARYAWEGQDVLSLLGAAERLHALAPTLAA